MDIVTLQAAKRAFKAATKRYSLFGTQSVVATTVESGFGYTAQSNGTDTAGNYRYSHQVTAKATDVQLVYSNVSNSLDGPNPITVKASLEPPVAAYQSAGPVAMGVSIPVTFAGQQTVTIPPGGFAVSDVIPVELLAVGSYLYSRTWVTVSTGGLKWPTVGYTTTGRSEGQATGVGLADATASSGSGNIPTVNGHGYHPAAVIGTPIGAVPTVAGLTGDSIGYGSGETLQDIGFLVRASNLARIGHIQTSKPGDYARDSNTMSLRRQRMALLAGATFIVDEQGRNDITNGRTLAQLQADKLAFATAALARSQRFYLTTVTPRTTSTDNWMTTVNQTPTSNESTRVAYNTWVRDGCPIDATTLAAVATGTAANVLRTGAALHPVTGWMEVTNLVESAQNSGVWKAPMRVVTDGAITSGTLTFTSATANFTSADAGSIRTIAIPGAGSAASTLVVSIASVTNSTTVVLDGAPAANTVSGATCGIGVYPWDGLHPATTGHVVIAAGLPSFSTL